MTFKNIKKQFIFALLFLVLLIAGCSQSNGTDKEVADAESVTDDEKSVINAALHQQPPTLDPHITTAEVALLVGRHMFEGLMALNEDHESVPMLAESVEEGDDGLTYTFHLRKGVKFHNGKEMTSEDVIASMERWMDKETSTELIYGGSTWEADGEYTAILKLDKPATGVIDALAPILQAPAIMPKEIIEQAESTGVQEIVGTGPFKLAEWSPDQYIHLEKFDEYAAVEEPSSGLAGKKEALVDEIYFHLIQDASTRMAGLSSGEYDIAYVLPIDSYEQLKTDESINTHEGYSGHLYLIFNKKDELFSDKLMRQAVNAALDVDEIMLAAYTNEDLYEMDHGYMPIHSANWYTEIGKEYYNQKDPEKAMQLLEEAGYDGQEITVLTSREEQNVYNAAVVIQEQMEKIGINVHLEVYDWATVSELREDPDKWGFYVNRALDVNIPAQILPLGTVWPGWSDDPQIVEMHQNIVEASSQEEAYELWTNLQEYAWGEYMPAAKLGNYYSFDASSNKLSGVGSFHSLVLWNTSKDE